MFEVFTGSAMRRILLALAVFAALLGGVWAGLPLQSGSTRTMLDTKKDDAVAIKRDRKPVTMRLDRRSGPNSCDAFPNAELIIEDIPDCLSGKITKDAVHAWVAAKLDGVVEILTSAEKEQRYPSAKESQDASLDFRDDRSRSINAAIHAFRDDADGAITWSLEVTVKRGAQIRPGVMTSVAVYSQTSFGSFGSADSAEAVIRKEVAFAVSKVALEILQGNPARIKQVDEAAKMAAVRSDLHTLGNQLDSFRVDCGRYPTTKEGLNALMVMPPGLDGKWQGPYLRKRIPKDPWGHAYVYKYPGGGPDSYVLKSLGSSGKPGGKTEIVEGE